MSRQRFFQKPDGLAHSFLQAGIAVVADVTWM